MDSDPAAIFDPVALQHYRAGASATTAMLRTPRGWLNWSYWLLVGVAAGALVFACLGSVDEYAIGAAVLRRSGQGFHLVVALPGAERPRLATGMSLHFELAGFPNALQATTLGGLEEAIVPSEQARRALGWSSAFPLDGPVVLAEASLPADGFTADGQSYRFYDGMQGIARVRTRRTRVAALLFPWLRGRIEPR